ncbi:MAG: HPr family phosphocarrier protein [candidate division WOR-3 bacterium]
MKRVRIVIPGPVGLHARPAADFVRVAERFKSRVRLGKDGVWVNGKSILQILSLAAEAGCEVILEVSGRDEDEAFTALKAKLEKSDT